MASPGQLRARGRLRLQIRRAPAASDASSSTAPPKKSAQYPSRHHSPSCSASTSPSTAPDGRLFRGEAGGLLSDTVYGRAWDKARHKALTKAEAASPLAERPYDLRHARLSTWLNAGVDPTQVAEWAGNSVAVLLRVYAKCISGHDTIARQRIEDALRGEHD